MSDAVSAVIELYWEGLENGWLRIYQDRHLRRL